jgi:hypothetical protein
MSKSKEPINLLTISRVFFSFVWRLKLNFCGVVGVDPEGRFRGGHDFPHRSFFIPNFPMMTPAAKGDRPSLPPLEYIIGQGERDIPPQTYNPQPPPQQTQNARYPYSPYENISGVSTSPDSLDSNEYPTNYYNRSSQHGAVTFFSRGVASINNPSLHSSAVSNSTSQHGLYPMSENEVIQEFDQEENEHEERILKRRRNTESAQRYYYCQCV